MITTAQRAKLLWQCRRGMLELDLLLGQFVEASAGRLSEEEFHLVEKLLDTPDPDLFAWLMGVELPQNRELLQSVQLVQLYATPRPLG